MLKRSEHRICQRGLTGGLKGKVRADLKLGQSVAEMALGQSLGCPQPWAPVAWAMPNKVRHRALL